MSDLRLTLFGAPKLEREGQPIQLDTRKNMALLVYLAMNGQEQSRETLAALLWPEQSERRARASLRQALSSLRQTLGSELLLASRSHVGIQEEPGLYVDVLAYLKLTDPCSGQSDPLDSLAPCREPLTQALALYTGDFLAGFTLPDCPAFDEWHFFQAESLRRSLDQALRTLIRWHKAEQGYELAIDYARRRLALDRLHEPAQRQLMELYALAGQQAAAVRQYEECVRVLDEELGVPPEEETEALYEAIRSRRFVTSRDAHQQGDTVAAAAAQDLKRLPSAPVAAATTPSNLPAQPTPFVGRQEELVDILRRLQDPDCRLLTLVGPGGMGKTRLAIETAQHLLDSPPAGDSFADGIFFVPLQPVVAESAMVSAMAEAANFRFYSDAAPREQLLDFLRNKRMLLVLDNFEHLLAAVGLVDEILTTAPGVKVLVTSREGLNLRQEWFQPLASMRFSGDPAASEQAVSGYDAVRLFVQSARRAQPRFALGEEEEHVLRICRLVDGMPLGIELAAAWLKVLSCAQIAGEIERDLDILTARHQDVPQRHRSMRVLMEQSWLRLSAQEQEVLSRLSVFRGGFCRGAAQEIAGASLLNLASLVESSLLQAMQDERYQMHELLRQFAEGKLAQDAQVENATRTQHSAFYLDYVSGRQESLDGPGLQTALADIGAEIDNIRAAWNWAGEQGEWGAIEQALDGLYSFYEIRSRYQDGEELFATTIAQLEQAASGDRLAGHSLLAGKLQARRGALSYSMGDYETASQCLEMSLGAGADLQEEAFLRRLLGQVSFQQGKLSAAEEQLRSSLSISREIGDLSGTVDTLLGLNNLTCTYGDYTEAIRLARDAVTISRQLGNPNRVARALSRLAWPVHSVGGYDESENYWRESLAICEEIGDPGGVASALNQLGWCAWSIGGARLGDAIAYYQQALSLQRTVGRRRGLANVLGDMALAIAELGEYEQAMADAREGFAIAEEIGQFDLIVYNLVCMGAAQCGLRDFQASRRHLTEALARAKDTRPLTLELIALYYWVTALAAESSLPGVSQELADQKKAQALVLLALVLEHPASHQPFKDRAARLRAELDSALPTDTVAAATARGQSRTLDEVVAEILNGEKKA